MSNADARVHQETARIAVPVGLEMVVQLLLGLIDQIIVMGAASALAVLFSLLVAPRSCPSSGRS